MEKETQKIDLVNPLNPNQIIKTEELIKHNNITNNEITETEIIKVKKKNKLILILALILFLIISLTVFTIIKPNVVKSFFNKSKETPVKVDKPLVETVDINKIIDNFNLVMAENNLSTIASANKSEIIINTNSEDEPSLYVFTLNDDKLNLVIGIDDEQGVHITEYMNIAINKLNNTTDIDYTIYEENEFNKTITILTK